MMPLSLVNIGEEASIKIIGGAQQLRQHLENLGFVVGGHVTVVSQLAGNLIVSVKDSRIAISREMASKIYV